MAIRYIPTMWNGGDLTRNCEPHTATREEASKIIDGLSHRYEHNQIVPKEEDGIEEWYEYYQTA